MPETEKPRWIQAPAMRSRFVLEMAAELVSAQDQPMRQARVLLKEQGRGDAWPINLFASSTIEGIEAVANGDASLAMINPAAVLTLAIRGTGPFRKPLPLRLLTTFPSEDAVIFAAKPELGLRSFEDIALRRPPLKLSVRFQRDHCLHLLFDDIAQAAGFTIADMQSWGGGLNYDGSPRDPKALALSRGANAIFDEAVQAWLDEALDLGLDILPMSESTVTKLEKIGYRRAIVRKADYPRLKSDLLTIDFSGWATFVHADLPEKLVTQMCAALEARKHLMPWQGEGPLPLERMCRDTRETPMDVLLHPAAEKFWKVQGYI